MELTFSLTERDVRRANFSIAIAKLSGWKGLQFAASSIVLACMFAVLLENKKGPDADLSAAAIHGIGFGLLFVLVLPLLIYFGAVRGARELLRSKAGTSGPFTYNFSNEGITSAGPTGHGETSWSSYPWIRETKHQFLLYPQKSFAYVIPKDCFTRPVDLEEFRDMLRINHAGEIRLLS